MSTPFGSSPSGSSARRSRTSRPSRSRGYRRERGGGPVSNPRGKGSGWRDDRVWQAGFIVGSALGAAATVLGRRAERVARQGLVDLPAAERYAVERLRSAPGAPSGAQPAGVQAV